MEMGMATGTGATIATITTVDGAIPPTIATTTTNTFSNA
jgi:hypothetical protein